MSGEERAVPGSVTSISIAGSNRNRIEVRTGTTHNSSQLREPLGQVTTKHVLCSRHHYYSKPVTKIPQKLTHTNSKYFVPKNVGAVLNG